MNILPLLNSPFLITWLVTVWYLYLLFQCSTTYFHHTWMYLHAVTGMKPWYIIIVCAVCGDSICTIFLCVDCINIHSCGLSIDDDQLIVRMHLNSGQFCFTVFGHLQHWFSSLSDTVRLYIYFKKSCDCMYSLKKT